MNRFKTQFRHNTHDARCCPRQRLALVLLFLVLFLGLEFPPVGCTASKSPAAHKKGVTEMSKLSLSLGIPNSELATGESLWVEVTLENTGDDPIEVPSPDSDREFIYRIQRTTPDPTPPITVSARLSRMQKTADTVPEMPKLTAELKPKEKLVYQEDLAPYIVPGPTAGRYTITAGYEVEGGSVASEAASVTIAVPRVKALAIVTSANWGSLSAVFVHQAEDGTRVVFQRDSSPKNFSEGILHRRVNLSASAFTPAVAATMELDFNPAGRWFAWLEEKGLGAGVAQEATLFAQVPPVALAVETPRLYPVGWQPSGEQAIYLVMGQDSQGRVILNVVSVEAAGTSSVASVSLSAARMPTLWAARLVTMEPEPTFDVVWGETGPGRTWLFKQTVTPASGKAGAVQALCEHSETLAAISLYPLKGPTADVVDLIYGPSKEAEPFNYLRLPLSGGNPILDIDIALPQNDPAIWPRAWSLASKPLEKPAALAFFDNQLMVLRMDPKPQWQVLNNNTVQAGHLRLEVLEDNLLWAIWADGQLGMQYQLIR
jgi:hypothetical protein